MSQPVNTANNAAKQAALGRRLAAVQAHEWDSWAGRWARNLRARNRSDATITAYLQSLTRLAEWTTNPELCNPVVSDPVDVDDDVLEEFFGWSLSRPSARGGPLSAATVHRDYRHLRVFFGWLSDKEERRSPMEKMKGPKVPEQPVDVFTDDELKAIVGSCKGRDFVARRDRALIRFLLDTGVRRAELAGMTMDDLDMNSQTAYVFGKGRRERAVWFGAKTAEALDDYLAARAKHKDRKLPGLWLAANPHRGALGYDGVRLVLERRGNDAGVDHVYAHRFRHTAAHAFFEAGGREGDAMRLFGWQSRSMCDRYGASAATRRALGAARAMSAGDRI